MEPNQLKPKMSPKDFFLHLGAMVALYVSAISLLNLVFDTINYAFPDALGYVDPYSGGMKLAVATLIIVFPIFLLLSWLLAKDQARSPGKRDLGIRRWLVYLTLFVAGIAVVVDLVVLVQTFLNGEITTRFVLKVLSVLIVAGGIFGYYIYDLRRKDLSVPGKEKLFGSLAVAVVLISIIGGFVIMGSPSSARERRFDDQRVSDLQNIQWQVVNYWQAKGRLPAGLTDLNDSISGYVAPTDPQTKQVYVYKVTGVKDFQLCADFNLANVNANTGNNMTKPAGSGSDNWAHDKGEKCFDRTIDASLYPVKPILVR